MSACWTLTHTGLKEGIAIVATGPPRDSHQVVLGEEWRLGPKGQRQRLVRTPTVVPFDRHNLPVCRDGRLYKAYPCKSAERFHLGRSRQNDNSALVFIDTAHTALCKTGGHWELQDDEATEIASGRTGQALYRLRHNFGSSSADHHYEIEEDTCYNKGLVLLPPNSQLTVVFHAPGRLTGVLRHLGNRPEFWIETDAVDHSYVYRHREGLRLGTVPPELL